MDPLVNGVGPNNCLTPECSRGGCLLMGNDAAMYIPERQLLRLVGQWQGDVRRVSGQPGHFRIALEYVSPRPIRPHQAPMAIEQDHAVGLCLKNRLELARLLRHLTL